MLIIYPTEPGKLNELKHHFLYSPQGLYTAIYPGSRHSSHTSAKEEKVWGFFYVYMSETEGTRDTNWYASMLALDVTFRNQRKSSPKGLTLVTFSRVALNWSPNFCHAYDKRQVTIHPKLLTWAHCLYQNRAVAIHTTILTPSHWRFPLRSGVPRRFLLTT